MIMKRILLTVALFMGVMASFSQARIQVIHNSADAALEIVDVWLNQTLLIDNFKFRDASAFANVQSGVQVSIVIASADSQDPNDPLWSQTFTFTDAQSYILVAEGIISASGYDPATPFSMALYTGARELANQPDMIDMLSEHGSTDAPTIDIYETGIGLGQIVDNLSYGEFDGYLELAPKNFIFEVRDEGGTNPIAAYSAPLLELGMKGKAITLVASGFLNPANNSNGPAFGLYLALPEGGHMIELRPYNPTARVQFIHNSADAALSVIDVWMNDTLLLDNFSFRTASAFLDLPAESEFTISVKDDNSISPDNPLWSHTYTLESDQKYIMVADGIMTIVGYEPFIPFDIAVFPQAQETGSSSEMTDILIHHGSTDAPTVDIYETGVGAGLLADDLAYGEFEGYLSLEPLDYIIEIRDSTGTTKLVAFKAPLETMGLQGFAITVVASGFLNPANNSDGPAFGLWVAVATGGSLIELPVYDPRAKLQLIHNSADAAAEVVDVWLDDELLLDNFTFRTASDFLNVPAGSEITLAITGPDSQGPGSPLWSANYTLAEDKAYIMVADGIISTSGYEPAVPFNVAIYPNARQSANNNGQTDVIFHHGSTDSPSLDIIEVGIGFGLMVDNLDYSQYAGYIGLATVNYILQVKDENGLEKLGSYQAHFATLGMDGEAVSILVSGFLDPENNSNGPAFGLFMTTASGGPLIRLPEYAPKARLQVIHNSADSAADVVDLWLDQDLILDNFAFRTASPFLDVPANDQITIAVKGPDSQDPYGALFARSYTLTEGETYILVAEGLLSQTGYTPFQPFNFVTYTPGREEASNPLLTEMLVHHGVTDIPAFDLTEIAVGGGTLVEDLGYGEYYNQYLELSTANYIFEVRDASGATLLGTFRAPFSTFGWQGDAITVVASGFLDPAANSNGPAFGLWAAEAAGGPMVEFVAYVPRARVQVIHNAADASLAEVDIWRNNELLLDNFAFRSATPFMDFPANTQFTIAVKGADSQDPSNPYWSQTYTMPIDETYILVADGMISPEGYDPLKPFSLISYQGALEQATSGSETDLLVFHGATDAPAVDVVNAADGNTLIDNLSYGSFDGYLELPTIDYVLNVTDESGSSVVRTYSVPLAGLNLSGNSLTLLASGFLDPSVNSDGPGFGLLAVQANGTASMLTDVTGIEETGIENGSVKIYPNPAFDLLNISFSINGTSIVSFEITDLTGRIIKSVNYGLKNAGDYSARMNVSDLNSGTYLLSITTGEKRIERKVFVR